MRNRLLVLTSQPQDPNPVQIISEAKKLGFDAAVVSYFELWWELSPGTIHITLPTPRMYVSDFDTVILRGAGLKPHDYRLQRGLLAREFVRLGKRVLNGSYYTTYPYGADKLTQAYILHSQNIETPQVLHSGNLKASLQTLNYPLVLKTIDGTFGNGVEKITHMEKGEEYLSKYFAGEVIKQTVIPGRRDIRVLVLGGKVLGAMERRAKAGAFVTNYSAGGSVHHIDLHPKVADLAIQAAQAFHLEYAGVDIMMDKGTPNVLEVNAAAEFQGFQKATGINVAREIVEYLVKDKE